MRYAYTHWWVSYHTVSKNVPKLLKRLTGHSSKPLGLLVPYDKKIVRRDPRQRDDEADARTERVGVEGQGNHEEACEGKQRRDEQRHLEGSTEASHFPQMQDTDGTSWWERQPRAWGTHWSHDQVTGIILPYLGSEISLKGHRMYQTYSLN